MNGRLIMRLVFQFISDALISRRLTYRAAAILVKMRKAIANWAWIRGLTSATPHIGLTRVVKVNIGFARNLVVVT
jgi:hypothetical protein